VLAWVAVLGLLASACSSISPQELASRYDDPTIDPAFGANSLPDPPVHGAALDQSPEGRPPRQIPLEVSPEACSGESPYGRECGRITIPPSPGSDAAAVEISFIRYRSTSLSSQPDPVVFLHGGPGGSVLADVDQFVASVVVPFIDERDVILYDQRGAGDSSPLPACDDAYRLDNDFFFSTKSHDELAAAYVNEILMCGEWFAGQKQFDLSEVNSAVHADDLVDLIAALGLTEVNLFANSYGTRLAQTMMRDHPEAVRSVLLNGIYPIEANLVGAVPQAFQAALNRLFDACLDDPLCASALPNPELGLVSVVDQLDREPIEVTVATGRYSSINVLIGGDDLINIFHGLLYTADGAAMIPDTIIDLLDGHTNRLRRLAQDSVFDIGDVAAYLAVQCHEEVPFTTADEYALSQSAASVYDRVMLPPGLLGSSLVKICKGWTSAGQASALENKAVSWEAPTLIMSGGIDPITPPWWAASLASRLPNATLAFSPDRGHDSSDSPCALGLMTEFVTDPESALDTSCTEQFERPLLNNTAERFLDGSELALISDNFDTDPGPGESWIDVTVPSWPVDYYETESAYWRNLDSYDPTVLVIRSGPFDDSELYWYLDVEVEGDYSKPTTVDGLDSNWERMVYETVGRNIVTYRRNGDLALNVSLIANSDEIEALEAAVLLPAVRSVVDP